MASYHFSASAVSFGKGQSAVAKAAYNARTSLRNERDGRLTHDYSNASEAVFSGIFAPKGAPEWAQDREELWNRAEAAERQANGQPARNVEFSLPHELTDQQREWLVKDFVRETFVRAGMVADVNIHRPHEQGDARNHHAHILLTMREIGPDGFAKTKNREWNRTEALDEWREKLAIMGARALERQGLTTEAQRFRHGHETLAEQRAAALERGDLEFATSLDREPTKHLGPKATGIERDGGESITGNKNREIADRNAQRADLREEYGRITAEIIDLAAMREARQQDTAPTSSEPAQKQSSDDVADMRMEAATAIQRDGSFDAGTVAGGFLDAAKGVTSGIAQGAIMVLDFVTDRLETLADFVASMFDGGEAKPRVYKHQIEQIQAERAALAAFENMAEARRINQPLSASDVRSLTYGHLVQLNHRGDAYLLGVLSDMERDRRHEKEREWGRALER